MEFQAGDMPDEDLPSTLHVAGLTKKYGRRGKSALSDVNLTRLAPVPRSHGHTVLLRCIVLGQYSVST
ncbi:hypothetical protein ACWEQU_03630 [Streptomyces nodosus]